MKRNYDGQIVVQYSPDLLLDLRDSEKLTYDSLGVFKEKSLNILSLVTTPLCYANIITCR